MHYESHLTHSSQWDPLIDLTIFWTRNVAELHYFVSIFLGRRSHAMCHLLCVHFCWNHLLIAWCFSLKEPRQKQLSSSEQKLFFWWGVGDSLLIKPAHTLIMRDKSCESNENKAILLWLQRFLFVLTFSKRSITPCIHDFNNSESQADDR